jgi:hypothetical protein
MASPKVGFPPHSEVVSHSRRVRSTPMNGHRQTGTTGPFRATNGLMHRNKFEEIHWRKSDLQCDRTPVVRNWWSGVQFIEQRLRFLQIECIEALGEPAVDRSEKLAGRILLTLIAPEPRHAHRCA